MLKKAVSLSILLVGFDEEEADGGPDELPDPDEQGDHDAGGGTEF